MVGDMAVLWDAEALVIVLAGTLVATLARCGWRDVKAALAAVFELAAAGFDADANRAALARCAPEVRQRGHLCAEAPLPPDRSIALLVKAYLAGGSLDALHSAARAERALREIARGQAIRVSDYAAEQAPVFGLVGTLFAITRINPAADAAAGLGVTEAVMGAVGTAVLSSLYGVLTAHLLCVPIAGAIERRAFREEAARTDLLQWFEAELTGQHDSKPRAPHMAPVKDAA
ncbi:MotA/TolQ/ExbB proton channel family protein [Qipengyuania sp. ASV99]|uniref:MotA/TolQ/ExbB proton channel family protein n=1 Tax=Qipengyuania sp. ASV99 TaxID=3399681 RepID=UPI003A4C6F1C